MNINCILFYMYIKHAKKRRNLGRLHVKRSNESCGNPMTASSAVVVVAIFDTDSYVLQWTFFYSNNDDDIRLFKYNNNK